MNLYLKLMRRWTGPVLAGVMAAAMVFGTGTAVLADEPGKCRFADIDEDEIRQRLQVILNRKG